MTAVAVGADRDQVEGLHAVSGLGCWVMLEQHERGLGLTSELGQVCPADAVTGPVELVRGCHGQVDGLSTGRQPHLEVSNTADAEA